MASGSILTIPEAASKSGLAVRIKARRRLIQADVIAMELYIAQIWTIDTITTTINPGIKLATN
jgi:hypothetical protein